MRRRILIVLLSIGTVVGFTHGFMQHRAHRGEFERHVADVCVDAARHAPATTAPH